MNRRIALHFLGILSSFSLGVLIFKAAVVFAQFNQDLFERATALIVNTKELIHLT